MSLAAKYSSALFKASAKSLPSISAESTQLLSLIKTGSQTFLSDPTLSSSAKNQKIGSLLKDAKIQQNGLMANFLKVLAENNRLQETESSLLAFQKLVDEASGNFKVFVTTAKPLEADLSKRLVTLLKQSEFGKKAAKLEIVNKVRPLFVYSTRMGH